jgi:hypothetical protein
LCCNSTFISAEKKVASGWQPMSSYAAFRHLTLDDVTPDTEQGKQQQRECMADVMERTLAAILCQGERKPPT